MKTDFKELIEYVIYGLLGIVIGLKLVPVLLMELVLVGGSILLFYNVIHKKYINALSSLIILSILEPYTRIYLLNIPYLFIQYVILAISLFLAINNSSVKNRNYSFVFFISAVILFELLNSLRYIRIDYTRSVLLNSLSLFVFVILGSKFTLKMEDFLLLCKKISKMGFLLACIIIVAQQNNEIKYTLESNFESSNGMPPVQLSFYLSVTLFVTYYIFNRLNYAIVYYIFILIQLIAMVMTFSRGGLYFFLFSIVMYHILITGTGQFKLKMILKIVIVPLILAFAYDYVTTKTDGKIIERYEEEGVSNRDLILNSGIKIFLDNPIIGVGTGNFNIITSEQKYYGSFTGSHNEFIRILAEHGLFGFLFYICFFFSLLFFIWKNRKKSDAIFSIIIITAFIFGSIHNGLKLSFQSFIIFLVISQSNAISFPHKRQIVS
jgi:O-antigen ligase